MTEQDRTDSRYDVVVVGGGAAGLSAALVLGGPGTARWWSTRASRATRPRRTCRAI
ncbi:hypothetical protein SALBM217S_10539 [Streptomyces griseoloalbus]